MKTEQTEQTICTRNLDNVLSILSNVDPYCVIAGGAPRDLQLGIQYSDIDVFMFVPLTWTNAVFENVVKNVTGLKIERVGSKETEMYASNPNIMAVYDAEINGDKVQIIRYTEPTFGIHKSFPLSICQTAYKDGVFYNSDLFKKTLKTEVICQVGTLYADNQKYIDKIKAKFPNYAFVNLKE